MVLLSLVRVCVPAVQRVVFKELSFDHLPPPPDKGGSKYEVEGGNGAFSL